nr:glycoprotein vIgFam2.3 [Elephant endotheliotropic herpesvirus 1A]AYF58547.1 glycoprotein vIgFam2.3 [Elephant endotheliotropic herpesvirus 1A]
MMVISRGGGLYCIVLYIHILECTDIIQKANIHDNTTMILYQSGSYSAFSWLYNNQTIANGNVSDHRSCNSAKYIVKQLPHNQCCDLTITDLQQSDFGNYMLRVSFAHGGSTEENVVLVLNSSSTVSEIVTKGTIPITLQKRQKDEELRNFACKCNLYFSEMTLYTFVYLLIFME